ncbi:aldose epimerase family protein [Ancylobacter mangrovi]|uniref:aldose epimerase family protein n=1 Tax=Ancylobacter mangrovi TaxID=2972472 RepID=UPI00216162B0|nr:aldose epimerase family protein [Ancylobacter mangrovi]MCS0501178.1 galactose mutarotase [Ancylobacter mangrovi]
MTGRLIRESFGALPDGRPVERLRLVGEGGFEAAIITYGAAVQALHVPDRAGAVADVVLGHDTLAPYLAHRRYFGAAIGRYANRIADGTFALDGVTYRVPANEGANALHGGFQGFDRRLWRVEAAEEDPVPRAGLSYVSPDGEEGFPGNLQVRLTYALPAPGTLSIAFEATTDRPTIANLTHHGFFNLAGVAAGGSVLDHHLTLHAEQYLPVDTASIPLDGPAPVDGTPFDFRAGAAIGARIRDPHEQLSLGHGYDHNYCLPGGRAEAPRLAARVEHPGSGRMMELLTDQPGLQFYSGNFLDGAGAGKSGRLHRQSDAFCLEPQGWPDAPNRPDYPGVRLDPGETYRHVSLYRFSTI